MHYIRSFSTLCLALAMAYFAYALISVAGEIKMTREQLPQLLNQVETMEKSIRVDEWLALAEHLDTQLPSVLAQVERTRATANAINNRIPSILKEVNALRQNTIPDVLKETTSIRKMLPTTLQDMNALADKAKSVSENATEGAIDGTLKSLVKAPITLIKSAGKEVTDVGKEIKAEGK